MFCQVLRAWLQPGAQCLTSSCRSVHKLASINSTKNLSQNKVGGMLYPFSVLEPYLDRFVVLHLCCSAVSYHCKHSLVSLHLSKPYYCAGLWTGRRSSSSIPVWRTWSKLRRSSAPHPLTGLSTTLLQRGWSTPPRCSSLR